MSTKGTKVPAIKNIPAKIDPELKSMLDSMKEAQEVRLGRRGDPRDRAVTLRELIDSGLAKQLHNNPFNPNAGSIPDFIPNVPGGNLAIPPAPTGLEASGAFTEVIISWNEAPYDNHAYTEVFRSRNDEIGGSILVTTSNSFVVTDVVGYGQTYFYWVRFVSTDNVKGPFNKTNGVKANTIEDIAATMAALSEELSALPGFNALTTLITNADVAVAATAAVASRVIRSSGAPSTREDGKALTVNDLWFDTDDGQVYTRNAANNDWVAARDSTLVSVFGATSFTGSTLTGAMASAQSDVATLSSNNTARVSEINALTATVTTKARTFIQNNAPTATAIGDIWIDSNDNNKMYRATATNNSSWVAVRDTLNDNYPRIFTQANPPTAVNTGDIWFDTNDSNKHYRWDGSNWVLVRDVTSQAAIVTEATARANADTASASLISNLTTVVNNNASAISTEATTRANADTASATLISNLTSTVGTKARTFAQNGVPTSIAAGDLWIDTNDSNKVYRAASAGSDAVTSGEWVLLDVGAALSTASTLSSEQTTRANADTALSTSISNLTSTVTSNNNTLTAAIGSEQTARSNADSANATSISNLTTTVGNKTQTFVQNSAPTAISVGDLWIDANDGNKLYRASATGASNWVVVRDTANDSHPRIFTQNDAPTAISVGDLWFDSNDSNKQYRATGTGTSNWVAVVDVAATAGVSTLTSAVSTLNGDAAAAFVLQVNANGSVGGMVVEANASSSGDNSGVAIQFRADKFAIWNATGSSAGSAATAPFIVANGSVFIADARIQDGAITNARIANATIEGAKISNATIVAANIANAAITTAKIDNLAVDNAKIANLNAEKLNAGLIDAARINVNTLNVKHFDNVSTDIKSHRSNGAFVPLGVEASVISFAGSFPGSTTITSKTSTVVNISCTTAGVRNNAKYRVVVSGVYGNIRNGTIQYSFSSNFSSPVSLSPKMNANAGTFRTYVFIWDGTMTGLSSTQSTVYWRINWNVSGGVPNQTYQAMYVTIDNTQ